MNAFSEPSHQLFKYVTERQPGVHEFVVEAFVDPAQFPQATQLVVKFGEDSVVADLTNFAQATCDRNFRGSLQMADLVKEIDAFVALNERRPRLLDLGGRTRSGNNYSGALSQCDVTVFDIVEDPSVDVVGDAHKLGKYFPEEHFDFVFCISVFEHLLMPWKVALELNKVMRAGGYCLINTHQTLGMHDLPWDFWRYSDTAWNGLFNDRTGFRVVKVGLGQFLQLVSVGWHPRYRNNEGSGGFESSGVLIQKIGSSDLHWDVQLDEVIPTAYPRQSADRQWDGSIGKPAPVKSRVRRLASILKREIRNRALRRGGAARGGPSSS
jgi:hypothetical protein